MRKILTIINFKKRQMHWDRVTSLIAQETDETKIKQILALERKKNIRGFYKLDSFLNVQRGFFLKFLRSGQGAFFLVLLTQFV